MKFFFFKTGSHYIALAGLKFAKLTHSSQRSATLCLQSPGIKGLHHYAQLTRVIPVLVRWRQVDPWDKQVYLAA